MMKFENKEDGVASVVAAVKSGFSVAVLDIDSGEYFSTVKIFKTLPEAVTYAKGI